MKTMTIIALLAAAASLALSIRLNLSNYDQDSRTHDYDHAREVIVDYRDAIRGKVSRLELSIASLRSKVSELETRLAETTQNIRHVPKKTEGSGHVGAAAETANRTPKDPILKAIEEAPREARVRMTIEALAEGESHLTYISEFNGMSKAQVERVFGARTGIIVSEGKPTWIYRDPLGSGILYFNWGSSIESGVASAHIEKIR